jgi:hypothetical protein
VLIFLQTLGGALVEGLATYAPGVDVKLILNIGATSIQSAVPPEYREGVTIAYNNALDLAYTVATAMAAISILGAVFVEWRSVKGNKKTEMAIAA